MEIKLSNSDQEFIGKKFNHLTVVEKGPSYVSPGGHKSAQWWCECDCEEHNKVLVRRSNLTSGNTKSCGCQNTIARKRNVQKARQSQTLDLTNQTFGELTALRPTDKRLGKNTSIVWECRCSCGSLHYAPANYLNAGRVESCGCNKDSKGVRKIKKILNENNISYVLEKTFEDCVFPGSGAKARFDFYIEDKFLLEFDGEQHFKPLDNGFFKESFEQRQAHDKYKNEYCKSNRIPLKRIPYTDIERITLESIMGDEYLFLW